MYRLERVPWKIKSGVYTRDAEGERDSQQGGW
jgi:hypothetical protein